MTTESFLLLLGDVSAKSVAVLLAAALIVQLWRRASAARKHFVWLAAMVILLFLPMIRFVSPHWRVSLDKPIVAPPPMAALPLAQFDIAPASVAPLEFAPSAPARRWPDWRTAVVAIWLGGVLSVMAYRLLGSWRLRRLEKESTRLDDPAILDLAQRILQELKVRRAVDIRVSDQCRVPLTWGHWRPVLLLPGEALQWSEERLAAAVWHEAGHISRHDYLVRWLAHFVCALYWPNPLIWLAARSLRVAQEQATDDLVLRAGTSPEEYAAQLFDAARAVAMHGLFARHAVTMATPSTLENRVLAIVDVDRDRRPMTQRTALAGSIAIVLVLTLCTSAQLQSADADATSKAPPATAEPPRPNPAAAPDTAQRRAERLIIPSIEFKGATLPEAIEFFRTQAKALSTDGPPPNIVYHPPSRPTQLITVSFKDIPLSEAAHYIAELAGVKLAFQPGALVFGDATTANPEAPGTAAPVALPILEKARTLVIPKFFLKEATVEDAVQALKAAARVSDPEGQGVNFVLKPLTGTGMADARITVQLTNIPVFEALRYISGLANLDFRAEPFAIILEPKKPANLLPIELKADNVIAKDGGTLAKGRVEIRCGIVTLTADGVYLDKTNRRADCIGLGQVKEGNRIVSGENLSVVFLEQGGISVMGSQKNTVVDPSSHDPKTSRILIPPADKAPRANSPVEQPSLALQAIHLDSSVDDNSATQCTLKIPIQLVKKTEQVRSSDLVLAVLFYDVLEDGKIVPTIANVRSSWETSPADWSDGDTETLVVRYQLPKADPDDGKSGTRNFYGFTVRLYYKNQLQSEAANPLTLLTQFPR